MLNWHNKLIQQSQAGARDSIGSGDIRDENTCSLQKACISEVVKENFTERIFGFYTVD